MLNELKNGNNGKLRKKKIKNEKVRVRNIKIFEKIMKRCRKESSMIGKRIWKIENSGKERVFFEIDGEDNKRNEKRGGLTEKELKN